MELKPSAYNLLVPSDDAGQTIVYNTASGALALVGEEAAALLSHALPIDDAACMHLGEDALSSLLEAGFLVDAGCDELAQIEASHRALQQDPSVLSLCIAPTYSCNLACPYCYENGRDSSGTIMDSETQGRIIDFAKTAFDAAPYERLEIQWYGGEPMLAPEAIERISAELLSFCRQHDVAFYAYMISNATLIGASEAALLKRSGVSEVVVTVDGPEELHNRRRPMRNGSNSYEAVLGGIGCLVDEGIAVRVLMNADEVNDPYLDDLRALLNERFGIVAARAKLNDYYGTFGQGCFCEPEFSLMDHREFTRLQCARFCEEGHTPQEFAYLVQPIPLFCRGQKERYYAIDAGGDVYKCDGRMGRTDNVLFNLNNVAETGDIPAQTAPLYPFDDPACRACTLLPLCKGTCEWERKCCTDHPCHPLKYTAEEYLKGWVRAIGSCDTERGVASQPAVGAKILSVQRGRDSTQP